MITESLAKLQERIERRYERIVKHEQPRSLYDMVKRFWSFIQSEPLLKSAVDKLQKDHSDQEQDALVVVGSGSKQFTVARTTNADQAAFASFVLHRSCQDYNCFEPALTFLGHSDFRTGVIRPFCDWLVEQLDDQEFAAGQLLAYKKRCEWFCFASVGTGICLRAS